MAARCGGGCDGREDGAVEALLQWQNVSDFLIGASYMSIPLVLLHFTTCADLAPLRWVLLQFGAFIVLCGVVHLAAFTAAKALAALAASAAAVSLPAFIPQLLRLKTREALHLQGVTPLSGLRVLLSDADGTSREMTRRLLERLGCQVLPAPSAAHCLGLLLGSDGADQPFLQLQVVLLDLHAPGAAGGGMDGGFEVARRIRELTSDSFGWLLILVALPLPARASCVDVRDVCQRTGVNGVVPKPVTLPALGAQLYRVLHNDT